MSSDASAAAASPMTNGTSLYGSHREADASTSPPSSHTLADVCADLHNRVTKFLNAEPQNETTKRTQQQTKVAMGVIEKALHDYGFDALSLSYNGGKDCLVLLILYLAVLHTYFTQPTSRRKEASGNDNNNDNDNTKTFPPSIPSIYAKPPDPFPAVTSFVDSSSAQYHLSLTHISTNPGTKPTPSKAKSHSSPPTSPEKQSIQAASHQDPNQISANEPHQEGKIITFRDAFALYLDSHPSVRAIFVGTRRTDPHGAHLTHFDMTDGSWPSFMRIHPVIDWHLSEIWTFLRSPHLAGDVDRAAGRDHVEYCAMYDEGYTSLGGVGDTLRNPKLKHIDPETGEERFRPAYVLTEDDEERLGRE
ncbi:3'-phosphoadenosine 5'-phosphosulfate sulfotransferase [Lithohypha guttulata]|uniref:3'-phosphoadenosine 5'-phosphosulfate sulfotransferase n=1 Tax=Lithohypha guttulata TaxID=1690604 RepID=UPI002DDF396D|nr:3'-phosphoadenosine 5'-phosphosulfate sulfotransferase [Lithohypha guttulata]